MPSFWERLFKRQVSPPSSAAVFPTEAADELPASPRPCAKVMRAEPPPAPDYYPNTFRAGAVEAAQARQPELFEPALQHFPRAFRLGEPVFENSAEGEEWRRRRGEVMEHLLRVTSGTPWFHHLVLRGSLLLKVWIGDRARDPGDIDWVVIPRSLRMNDALAKELVQGLTQAVAANTNVGDAEIDADKIVTDDIWTYDRAPGVRIVFPWSVSGIAQGSVQMDLVFEEELWIEPEWTPVTSSGDPIRVRAATRELALAWKLMWLESDIHPQGKDLYDAVMLAEQTALSFELLEKALRAAGLPPAHPIEPDFPLRWDIDWENFTQEYPQVAGTAEEWQKRLKLALSRTFSARPGYDSLGD
jgi:hypothetical protein